MWERSLRRASLQDTSAQFGEDVAEQTHCKRRTGQRAQKRKGGGTRRWGEKKKKRGLREASCALVGRAGLNGTRAVGVFVYEGEIGQGRKGCDSIQV